MILGLSLAAIGGMALTALWVSVTPGPNMIYLASRSINQGVAAGLTSLAGTAVGFLIYMTMANFGISFVFVAVPWLYIGLKVVGVLYLLWLAWKALKPNGTGVFEVRGTRADRPIVLFRMGLFTNLLNPKVAVLYLALIPQFINASAGNIVAQGFVLGAVQIAVSMVVNSLVIFGAGSIAHFLAGNPRWQRLQRWITGAMLGAVAVFLAREIAIPARAAS